MHNIPRYILSNGIEMPAIGQGTYPMTGKTLYGALKGALECGCTLIDTAHNYPNEANIGSELERIFNEGKFHRNDTFLTSKIGDRLDNGMPMGYYFYNSDSCPNHNHGEVVFGQVEKSLKNLRTDYLDLLLIHWPYSDCLEEIWLAMEELYRQGKVRAIGVSNHRERHLRRILEVATIRPMVNQIYFTPLNTQQETLAFCRANKIQVEAYSPLMFLHKDNQFCRDNRIKAICGKYGKTTGQIVLRWDIQHQVIPIPKAAGLNHIRDNYDIFDFSLSDEEMTVIDGFNVNYQYLPESVYCPGY